MRRAHVAWAAALSIASASVDAGAQAAPCPAPSEPSFRAPDWADEREGISAPSEAEARAWVQRLESAVQTARADDPATGETLRQLAEAQRHVYRANGDPSALQEATRTYARTIRDHPSHPKMDLILFRLAWCLEQQRQPQRARQVYHRLISRHPTSPYVAAAYVSFGEHYWGAGDLRAAQQFYDRAAALDAGAPSAYARYMDAWCLHRLGDHAQARASLNLARALLTRSLSGTARALAAAVERDACTIAR